jgi:hypothetical protein
VGRDPVVEERGGHHYEWGSSGRGAAGSLSFREEAVAGSRGAGVERGAATGARARGVTPGGRAKPRELGEQPQMLCSCMAVVEPRFLPDAVPTRRRPRLALCDAPVSQTRTDR